MSDPFEYAYRWWRQRERWGDTLEASMLATIDPSLFPVWGEEIERWEVWQQVSADCIRRVMIVCNPDESYRPIDWRTIHDIRRGDPTWGGLDEHRRKMREWNKKREDELQECRHLERKEIAERMKIDLTAPARAFHSYEQPVRDFISGA